MGARATGGTVPPVSKTTCGFPGPSGPCPRAVDEPGSRCKEHHGLDVRAAAAEMAKAARARQAAARHPRPANIADTGTPMSDEQIAAVAGCLNRHGVEYVLIGGGAALLHGAPIARTRDADIVPAKRDDNLNRLAAALREMDARLWVGPAEPEGLEMVFDRTSLGQIDSFLNLVTQYGPLDVTYRPEGTEGYDELVRSVVAVQLLGVDVPVASLADVIRSKEAAGRAKDLSVLPDLIDYLRRRKP
jgi:hypothetical protein